MKTNESKTSAQEYDGVSTLKEDKTDLNQQIQQHYLREGLLEEILSRLSYEGIDPKNLERSDIAGVDEFHVRGAEVSKELAQSIDLHGRTVLDLGCGIGGPSRMLADEYDCQVTGIDLSSEFIRTATGLSKLVGLDQRTNFVAGDATDLPFADATFEVVWTQHAQMNIRNKAKLYSEINRVLKPGGSVLYYDIFRKNDQQIEYPMPWASVSNFSFLFKPAELHKILGDLGLQLVERVDQTPAGIHFFDALVARLQTAGPPKVGLNLLMGANTKPKLLNLLRHFKQEILMLESGIYRKSWHGST